MTNQDENKNRNHINTGVSFNFIHYLANILGQRRAKWQNGSLLHHFRNKILFTKKILLLPKSFISYKNLIIVCIVPTHALSAGGNRFLKNTAWSRMSNFLKPEGDEKNHGGIADWEAQVKTQWINLVTRKCISQ